MTAFVVLNSRPKFLSATISFNVNCIEPLSLLDVVAESGAIAGLQLWPLYQQ